MSSGDFLRFFVVYDGLGVRVVVHTVEDVHAGGTTLLVRDLLETCLLVGWRGLVCKDRNWLRRKSFDFGLGNLSCVLFN